MLQYAKRFVKQIMGITPYKIVRRESGYHDAVAHNSLDNMDRLFGKKSFLESYENPYRRRLHNATAALIREVKPASEVSTIADFGCGPAAFFHFLPDYSHAQRFGYDFANATLEAARRIFPDAVYEQYDLYTPPPRQHDLVICSQTIEHLTKPWKAVQHLIEATLPKGVLIITVPDGRVDTFRGHIQFWSIESWQSALEDNVKQRFETRFFPQKGTGTGNLAAVIWKD